MENNKDLFRVTVLIEEDLIEEYYSGLIRKGFTTIGYSTQQAIKEIDDIDLSSPETIRFFNEKVLSKIASIERSLEKMKESVKGISQFADYKEIEDGPNKNLIEEEADDKE